MTPASVIMLVFDEPRLHMLLLSTPNAPTGHNIVMLPRSNIKTGESIFDAARRGLLETAGLQATEFGGALAASVQTPDAAGGAVNLVTCRAEGRLANTGAAAPEWVSKARAFRMLTDPDCLMTSHAQLAMLLWIGGCQPDG